MPVTQTYPGVYVQTVTSDVKTIAGISTSIPDFIIRTKKGSLNELVLCLNCGDFERSFSSGRGGSDLAHAVRQFFQNGGTQCCVMRIASGAIVGLIVRIDVSRGVWKAPARTEDDLRRIVSMEY